MKTMFRPGVGVGVFVIRDDGKILMQKRTGKHSPGTWSLPGGHMELFETLEHTAKREVLEETDVICDQVRFLAITNDHFRAEGKHYITIFVRARWLRGEPRPADEFTTEVKWMTLAQIKKEPHLFLPLKQFLAKKCYPQEWDVTPWKRGKDRTFMGKKYMKRKR